MARPDYVEDGGAPQHNQPASRFPIAVAYILSVTVVSLVFQDLQAGGLAIIVLLNYTLFVVAWQTLYRPKLSYVDPGLIFATVVMMYSVIPLLTTAALDYNFSSAQDGRLGSIALTDDIISVTVANANAILAGFGAGYFVIRSPRMPVLGPITAEATSALWLMLGVAVTVQVGLAYAGRGSDSYGDEYLLVQSMPVAVIQMLNIIGNLFYVALFGLIANYMRLRRLDMVALLVLASTTLFLLTTSARTSLVLVLLATIVCWDHLHMRLRPLAIAVLFAAMVTAFLVLGALRGGSADVATAFSQSEFMAVFVTALDIRQIYLTGWSFDMGAVLFIGDLLRLVPQQLMPFEKVDPASWYVSTFYPTYAAQGGGFAFGMLAETALSGGFGEALVRGLVAGMTLGFVLNIIVKRSSLWVYLIYLWLITSIYQSFRDTTFALVGRFVFQMAPALLLCMIVAMLLRNAGSRRGATSPSL